MTDGMRYQQYLNPQQPAQEESNGSILGFALKAGAVAGGIYGFHKLGGTSLAARYLMPKLAEARGAIESAEALGFSVAKNLRDRSIFSLLTDEVASKVSADYAESLGRTSWARRRAVGAEPSEFINKRAEFLETMQTLPHRTAMEFRNKSVMEQIRVHSGDEAFNAIQSHLDSTQSHLRDNFMSGAGHHEIQRILKKANLHDDAWREQISTQISTVIKTENEKYRLGNLTPETRDEIKQALKANRANLEREFKKTMQVKNDFFSKVMGDIGYRQVTVGDMVNAGLFDDAARYIVKNRGRGNQTTIMDMNKKIGEMVKKDPSLGGLRADSRIFINEQGNIMDFRHIGRAKHNTLDFLANNFQVPIVNFNPLRLFHWISWEGIRNAPFSYTLLHGTKQPVLTGSKDTLQKSYLFAGSSVYDIMTGDTVKENLLLASGRFGLFPRALAGMAGYQREEVALARKNAGFLQRFYDIGQQESQSDISKLLGIVTKFDNPNWARNTWNTVNQRLMGGTLTAGDLDKKLVVNAYKDAYNLVNRNAEVMNDDALVKLAGITDKNGKALAERYGLTPEDFKSLTNQDVMQLMQKMVDKDVRQGSKGLAKGSPVEQLMKREFREWARNPNAYDRYPRTVADDFPDLPGSMGMLTDSERMTRLVSPYEDSRKFIQMDLLYQLQNDIEAAGSKITVGDAIKGAITGKDAKRAEELALLNKIRGKDSMIFNNIVSPYDSESQMKGISAFLGEVGNGSDRWFGLRLDKAVKEYTPWWGAGPGQRPPEYFGGAKHLVVNDAMSPLRAVNDVLKSGGGLEDIIGTFARKTIGQLGFDFGFGFRAGRGNLSDVTTASVISYHMFNRLNEALGKAGLALGNENLGSAQDVFMNLIGRRMMLPLMTIGYMGYANYMVDQATGMNPKEGLADAYVGSRLSMAKMKDFSGITGMQKRWKMLHPGSDQMGDWIPGQALDIATFGLVGDTRSYEEQAWYYAYGNDPQRKGRYWSMGSSTPWSGGRVDFYAPNWWKRMKTDYMMSDTMYGSRREYYSHQWYPTLENPFGALTPIFFDPHHWVNKHRDDRPYPETGGISILEEIPIAGPMASKMLGALGIGSNTRRGDFEKAHRDYIRDINNSIKQQAEMKQGYLYSPPTGGWSMATLFPEDGGTPGGYAISVGGAGVSTGTGVTLPSGSYNVADLARGNIKAMNQAIISRAAVRPLRLGPIATEAPDLDEPESPNSMTRRAGETWYSLTEMAGIYGFMVTGGDNKPAPAIASGSYMSSYGRSFWDMNMGGYGGMVSEIFRRFMPNNKDRRKDYNPYRNKMPDWLPGPEYFTDFRHGDPYAKIPMGEARLPGSGYERLNRLHPDQFGQYGAIDRMKILADIAPMSDQYVLWKDVVSRMDLSEFEKREVRQIKEEVTEKKKKLRMYPYRFKYADITKETVHVERVLDQNTFLTTEYPNHPIRLAGINVVKSAPGSMEALQEIEKVIYTGAELKIGLEADPMKRVKNDTLQTMHAVIYEGGNSPLQARLLRKIGGDIVKEKEDDYSAVAVHSRFYSDEITVGKLWEWFAHLDTPFHTKFLQVRSPLEMYKRAELYGKEWQPWTEPISSILRPTLESFASRSPIQGAILGGLLGRIAGSSPEGKLIGSIVGSVTVGSMSTARVISDTVKGDQWIPERRRKERAMNEYFDILKYMKFQGLYEKAKLAAKKYEGIDIEEILAAQEEKGSAARGERSRIKALKRWLKQLPVGSPSATEDRKAQIKALNQQLNGIAENRQLAKLGPYSVQALYYNLQTKSTVYGADPLGDVTSLYRALPKKDRMFFQQFLTAAPEEREEILRLVPKDQRRFYQARWGLKIDERRDLEEYFKTHYLPGTNWEGWKPGVSIDDIKIKAIKNEALDMTEFGYWEDDVANAQGAPEINPWRPTSVMTDISMGINRVLRGAGINDYDVQITHGPAAEAHEVNVQVDLERNRESDILNIMNTRNVFATAL